MTQQLIQYAPSITSGFLTTLLLSAAILATAIPLGLALALVRQYARRTFAWPAAVFVNAFRVVPALLVLFFVFYASPQLGLRFPPIVAAYLGMTLVAIAYVSEDIRGGLAAVDAGQAKAAKALGLSSAHTIRRIVAPQALPLVIPPVFNRAIIVMKGTSLASFVAVSDLTGAASRATAITYQPFVFIVLAGGLYLLLSGILAFAQSWAERRFAIGRRPSIRTASP